MFDVIIVGSGASGTAAALALKGLKTLILDVGNKPDKYKDFEGNLYDLKKNNTDIADMILGDEFESLNNISFPFLNPKLKAPLNRFITKDSEILSPIEMKNCNLTYSMAMGGMANAWGAGAYRFLDFELDDFPIVYKDLEESYDFLTQHMGISGAADDLSSYLGTAEGLQSPAKFSRISEKLYLRYKRKRSFFNRSGFKIGQLRQAVITEDLEERRKLDYSNLEFYRPMIPSVYNPVFSLMKMIKKKELFYEPLILVESYAEESPGCVVVKARNLSNSQRVIFKSKALILAAGPLNTSKIVLTSNGDHEARLGFQENAISYIPLFEPFSVGQPVEKYSVPASLGMVYSDASTAPVWVSLYGLSGPLKSEFIMDFPFSIQCNLLAAKYCTSGMMVAQTFYPGESDPQNFIALKKNGELLVHLKDYKRGIFEKKIIEIFRKIGFFSHISLCKFPSPGNSFHYGCNLPMKNKPTHYETDKDGLLFGTKGIYIADSSNFSSLPAKNLTFTMMANSHRIASNLKKYVL